MPVSYTHLDVYKRQIYDIIDNIYKLPLASKEALLNETPEVTYPKGFHLFLANRKSCLLYTSEYLGWHSKNLRLVNCRISGTQPLCYAHDPVSYTHLEGS